MQVCVDVVVKGVLRWTARPYKYAPVPQIPTQAGFIFTCPRLTCGIEIFSKRRSCWPWNLRASMVSWPSGRDW